MGPLSITRHVVQDDYTEEMPKYPGATLVMHVATKGLQAGSLLSAFVVMPALYLRGGAALRNKLFPRVMTALPIITSAVTTSMLYGMVQNKNIDNAGIDDRAFRLTRNKGQIMVDKFTAVGAAAGSFTGMLTGTPVIASAFSGAAAGVVGYFAFLSFLFLTTSPPPAAAAAPPETKK